MSDAYDHGFGREHECGGNGGNHAYDCEFDREHGCG